MFVKSNDINMVLEFCPIDLQAVIKSHLPLQAEDIKSYMIMTLRGVEACHKAWVLHRVSVWSVRGYLVQSLCLNIHVYSV